MKTLKNPSLLCAAMSSPCFPDIVDVFGSFICPFANAVLNLTKVAVRMSFNTRTIFSQMVAEKTPPPSKNIDFLCFGISHENPQCML